MHGIVVERRVTAAFVPNDVLLNATDRQLMILTGPNMGGSRPPQTALLGILAQMGSFCPRARQAVPVDRIFARVGASDNITRGNRRSWSRCRRRRRFSMPRRRAAS
jgi:DNA mismatch repair protein MutS